MYTYRTNKALKTPLPPKCFNRTHPISDCFLTAFAFRRTKPNVTSLTIRVTTIYRESNLFPILIQSEIKGSITLDIDPILSTRPPLFRW